LYHSKLDKLRRTPEFFEPPLPDLDAFALAFPFFDKMFMKAKSGAIILFVDNGGSTFSSWFDELASQHDICCLQEETNYDYHIGVGEEKTDLEPYFSKLNWRPKLTANISYRICRKL